MAESPVRTTGTATSRARSRRPAVRRPTLARLALSGPSGSGKTWTALSIAEVLAQGGEVLVIDTERGDDAQGAAELYADQFAFAVIEWSAPYDPRDLAITLDDLSAAEDRPAVVIIDSASHFWRGQGGTLDIAGGKFGGWRTATPAQDDLVSSILAARFHVIVCTRARQDYAVEEGDNGKQRVTKLGLAPVQRDDLEYEFQVVLTLDHDHRIDVSKTRAQPLAGQSWMAGQQGRLATTYAGWLRSGVQLARQEDVEAVREVIRTAELGPDWQRAGWPKVAQLDAADLPNAWAWLAQQLGLSAHAFEPRLDDPERCRHCETSWRALWHADLSTDDGVPEPSTPVEESVQPEPPAESPARQQARAEGRQGEIDPSDEGQEQEAGSDRERAAQRVAESLRG